MYIDDFSWHKGVQSSCHKRKPRLASAEQFSTVQKDQNPARVFQANYTCLFGIRMKRIFRTKDRRKRKIDAGEYFRNFLKYVRLVPYLLLLMGMHGEDIRTSGRRRK